VIPLKCSFHCLAKLSAREHSTTATHAPQRRTTITRLASSLPVVLFIALTNALACSRTNNADAGGVRLCVESSGDWQGLPHCEDWVPGKLPFSHFQDANHQRGRGCVITGPRDLSPADAQRQRIARSLHWDFQVRCRSHFQLVMSESESERETSEPCDDVPACVQGVGAMRWAGV
jgi:hypothetical protein